MPLISDAKSIYVGTTPINMVLAGHDVVWQREKLTELQFYYGTTNPDYDKSPSVGGTPSLYASWRTNQRPAQCSESLGTFGMQHSFDSISTSTPQWNLYNWDNGKRALPASEPGLMVMQVHSQMYPYDTRFRLSNNNPTGPTHVFSEEVRIGASGSTDPNYILYTSLPKLPFEWLEQSECTPPLIVPVGYRILWYGTWYNVVYWKAELDRWEAWASCDKLKTFYEYQTVSPDNKYSDWKPFDGWLRHPSSGPDRRLCELWLRVMENSQIDNSARPFWQVRVRETGNERVYSSTNLIKNDPEITNTNSNLTCLS